MLPQRPVKTGSRRRLLRQVEFAVLGVLEGVQRTLMAVGVPVTALGARLIDYCWHGGFLRSVADGHQETAQMRSFLRWASAA